MFALRLKLHEIHHIYDPNFQIGNLLAKKVHRSQRLQGGNISGTGHDHIGLSAFVVTGPFSNPDTSCAMLDGRIHAEKLQTRLFPRDNSVDEISTSETFIRDNQQAIGIRRQINSDHFGFFVGHMINKPRALMRKSIVILPPHMGHQKIIEWGNGSSVPGDLGSRHFHPLGMLVEHRIDKVNECFIAGEKSVTSSQQIAF